MDTILFSLLVLKSITNSHGQLWRCHKTNILAVEVTIPDCKVGYILFDVLILFIIKQDDCKQLTPMQCTLRLLEMLPSVKCVGPQESMSLGKLKRT